MPSLLWKCVKGSDVLNGSLFISLSCLLVVPVIFSLDSREDDANFFELVVVQKRFLKYP